jgi:hypothetical protein
MLRPGQVLQGKPSIACFMNILPKRRVFKMISQAASAGKEQGAYCSSALIPRALADFRCAQHLCLDSGGEFCRRAWIDHLARGCEPLSNLGIGVDDLRTSVQSDLELASSSPSARRTQRARPQ